MMTDKPARCESRYITQRTLFFTDLVKCQHPVGHSQRHQFVYPSGKNKGITLTWSDADAMCGDA